MNKELLLQELSRETFVALRPSPVHGIGVFAIRDIPKGTKNIFSNHKTNWLPIPIAEIEKLPQHSRNLVETYCLFDEENYFVPEYGFKQVDLVIYLNHSGKPNIRSVNDGEYFEALEDIAEGTELVVNYSDIAEVEEYH